MQRLLRDILLLLLSLSLPLTGLASVIAPSDCAMHTAYAEHKAHAGMHQVDSCCQDQHQKKSGDLCKNGYACSGITLPWFSATSPSLFLYVPHTAITTTQPATQLATNAPAAVWRPPQH